MSAVPGMHGEGNCFSFPLLLFGKPIVVTSPLFICLPHPPFSQVQYFAGEWKKIHQGLRQCFLRSETLGLTTLFATTYGVLSDCMTLSGSFTLNAPAGRWPCCLNLIHPRTPTFLIHLSFA